MTYGSRQNKSAYGYARNYAAIGLESEVLSASPQKLIALLFDGAIAAIRKARLHLRNGHIAERGAAISKAIEIVDSGLKASVNLETGGEVAKSLVASYEIVVHHLIQANLKAEEQRLDISERVLVELSDAWKAATLPATGHANGVTPVKPDLTNAA